MAPPPATTIRAELARLVHPPLRADGRRNYEALLTTAAEVFEVDGPDASLDEIARRAGVGNATLYRHFPTRRDLLLAVCVGDVERLCALGERLRSHSRPGDALQHWLRAYVEHIRSRSGLAAAFVTGRSEDSMFAAACRTAVSEVASALLRNAQQVGTARADLDLSDLLALVNAIAVATESSGAHQAKRLLRLVVEGIRPR